MKNYLDILEESLHKKSQVLDDIMEATQKQLEMIDSDEMSLEGFDVYVDQKSEYIDELLKLDEGFEILYQNLAEELKGNREKYAQKIALLQKLITEVTEKSVSVQAMEARTKQKVEAYFKKEKHSIQTARKTSQAAMNYYQNMNNMKAVSAQFMDKKK
ncbi:MAG: hypothetical protein GX234_09275 [Clostridiales bacterium]|nr:hypothetical protein [Clostridiales bacterium]